MVQLASIVGFVNVVNLPFAKFGTTQDCDSAVVMRCRDCSALHRWATRNHRVAAMLTMVCTGQ
jgi:hypothetical protein